MIWEDRQASKSLVVVKSRIVKVDIVNYGEGTPGKGRKQHFFKTGDLPNEEKTDES